MPLMTERHFTVRALTVVIHASNGWQALYSESIGCGYTCLWWLRGTLQWEHWPWLYMPLMAERHFTVRALAVVIHASNDWEALYSESIDCGYTCLYWLRGTLQWEHWLWLYMPLMTERHFTVRALTVVIHASNDWEALYSESIDRGYTCL